jgi:DNA-binding YbaB/EbfC family protein
MSIQLSFNESVPRDLRNALAYYEENVGRDVADSFYEKLMERIEQVRDNPQQFPFFECDIRRTNLDRFPYNLLYRTTGRVVRILVLRHNRRNPRYGTRRRQANPDILMNIQKLMKQAQQMQAGLAAKQEELAQQTVEAAVGGGKVTVVATCAGDVLSIRIDPSVIDPEDAEFLEGLVLKGVQEAIARGKEKSAAEMQKLTGGLGIPGM